MSLKQPEHKIQSSFAVLEFTCKELPIIQNPIYLNTLTQLPDATIKNIEQAQQIVIQTRLCVFAYHVEILKQSLREYIQRMNFRQLEHLEETSYFLQQLRNALSHTNDKLVPRWNTEEKKQKNKRLWEKIVNTGITIRIPVIEERGGYRFNEKSKSLKIIIFKIRPGKTILINTQYISKIRLLSWHVLTITKKQKLSTLSNYLVHTKNIKASTSQSKQPLLKA
jgi:hypothetical protein